MAPRVSVSRDGLRFLVLLLIIGFAAYNTRNNLLYLVLSVGIASVVVSFFAGWASLRGLGVSKSEMPDAYAGSSFRERIRIGNRSRWLDALGLELENETRVPLVERNGEVDCTLERLYRRRGRYRVERLQVRTGFPFGFFRLTRRLPAFREVIVFPRVRPVRTSALFGDTGASRLHARRRGAGEEFYRLRGYVPGDHLHRVHWRTSAKLGELTVRELGDDGEERYVVAFEPVGEEGADFEILVSATASIVAHLVSEGISFRFVAEGWPSVAEVSRDHARDVLEHLALVRPRSERPAGLLRDLTKALGDHETVLYVTHTGEAPASLADGGKLRPVIPERLFVARPPESSVA